VTVLLEYLNLSMQTWLAVTQSKPCTNFFITYVSPILSDWVTIMFLAIWFLFLLQMQTIAMCTGDLNTHVIISCEVSL